ncbi:calcineurin-like phosphoesterase C-terminal domain-containing protein [Arthrobacter sp.]|uniref:calcineurin-like phosphoesterase C-terminal domain-containing protein n=1 Tax=Arthrobacter sp. TaxID=1667 RepID=UPI003A90E567
MRPVRADGTKPRGAAPDSIDGARPTRSTRTQQLQGEDVKTGVEYSDPAAIQEQFTGGGGLADRTMHLWRLDLPQDLAAGKHTAKVTATDVHGRKFTESLPFEVTE